MTPNPRRYERNPGSKVSGAQDPDHHGGHAGGGVALTRIVGQDARHAARAFARYRSFCASARTSTRLFVVEVGPFGRQLAEDARAAWLATGNKTKPSDVEEYVALLAQHIADAERRDAFSSEARACIHV